MKKFGSELLLLLTAAIWGFAFVAQRQGMQYMDPLLFNGIRFALGALVVGLITVKTPYNKKSYDTAMPFPWLLGSVLFVAASLQQIGIMYTSAGNAGFITGLYVVFVPLLGIFRKHKISRMLLIAILLSVTGLYMINSGQGYSASMGNLIVLLSAVFWAWHIHLIDVWTKSYDTLKLAFCQYAFCALASLCCGLFYNLFRQPDFLLQPQFYTGMGDALLPLLYSGVLSVGIGYTLPVQAQKKVPPAPATIIMCLEGVFALLGGWLLLSEKLSFPILLGAMLILSAMLLSVFGGRAVNHNS